MGLFSFFKKRDKAELPPLRFHNTLSGNLDVFEPLSRSQVSMYNCGPTVYDEQHIGNLKAYIFADTLRRVLNLWGYKVRQVINITDVGHLVSDADEGEDKMEASAKKQGLRAQDIAERVTDLFFKDLDQVGIDRSKIQFPRATKFIAEQIALVKALWEKGYAYQIDDGIYFDTAKFKEYGKLGHIDLEHLKEGARVEENMQKKSPHDFALWKFSKKGEKRQQEWKSPWGKGFPGWHIECTAMIFKLLGKQIDIHTGGIDHIPVHHNNEIAQAEAITGKQYVRYWMHGAFITIEGKKISKSLGNTVYLRNIIDRGYSARALRYLFLTAHYRTPMNFTWEAMEGASQALSRLSRTFLELPQGGSVPEQFKKELYAALSNDLDTPSAIARVWEFTKDTTVSPAGKRAGILLADRVLGLGLSDARPSATIKVVEKSDLPEEVQTLMEEREAARKAKEFEKADELRKKIEGAGYEIKDLPERSEVVKK
ncbi:MAG TPA: cysteine--tRNA ligase [Candidatus Paceibacterota bacterium]|nr:cysteine--tRNA ligase [Candidatus Paceibacterota bacterium]